MLPRETPWTWANLVTAIRVVACLPLFAWAFATRDETWNFVGLAAYWLLDVLDGWIARRLDQETRLGAQLDVLADRLLVCLFYLNYAVFHPAMLVPVMLFLVQFMGIDHYLSNQWMRWPILSPNYFFLVDPRIWALNWSPVAKFVNSAVVTVVLVGTASPWLGSAVALAIIAVKAWSVILLLRLPPPEDTWRLQVLRGMQVAETPAVGCSGSDRSGIRISSPGSSIGSSSSASSTDRLVR